jgi:hypothetical protein
MDEQGSEGGGGGRVGGEWGEERAAVSLAVQSFLALSSWVGVRSSTQSTLETC